MLRNFIGAYNQSLKTYVGCVCILTLFVLFGVKEIVTNLPMKLQNKELRMISQIF